MSQKRTRLMTVLEVQHVRDGKVIWEARDLPNTLHFKGEEVLLKCLFQQDTLPSVYYFGMDARATPAEGDVIANLTGEPTGGGYLRSAVNTGSSHFTVESVNTGHYRAVTEIMTFSASVADWGPVTNLFMTNTSSDNDANAVLIASAPLGQSITVAAGESILVRMGISLFGV